MTCAAVSEEVHGVTSEVMSELSDLMNCACVWHTWLESCMVVAVMPCVFISTGVFTRQAPIRS